MADEKDSGEKTEEPTQQRKLDFRKKGQVAQTKELSSVLALFGGSLALWFLGSFFLEQLTEVFEFCFAGHLVESVRSGNMFPAFKFAAYKGLYLLFPILLMSGVLAILSSISQVGFVKNEEALKPSLKKINPANGLQRIFGLRGLMEGIKALAKVILILTVIVLIMKSEVMFIPQLVRFSLEQIIAYMGSLAFKLLMSAALFLLLVAGLDFFYQRWELDKKMKMSKQEVKEEHKSLEGDPLIKSRIRRIQREMASKRMMDAIPKADVIITNPTHIAVAIQYDMKSMIAPQVIAKGADLLAEKIKKKAQEHHIPILENKPLARVLYKTIKIGQTIPRELYTAVAEVLSYVFKLKKKKKGF